MEYTTEKEMIDFENDRNRILEGIPFDEIQNIEAELNRIYAMLFGD